MTFAPQSILPRLRGMFDPCKEIAYIPLDQIIGYPRRSKIEFEDDNELRSLGSMTRGEGAPGTQKRPGRRHGWTSLGVGSYVAYVTTAVSTDRRVAVGLVGRNNQEQQTIEVQPHRGHWFRVKVIWKPHESRGAAVLMLVWKILCKS